MMSLFIQNGNSTYYGISTTGGVQASGSTELLNCLAVNIKTMMVWGKIHYPLTILLNQQPYEVYPVKQLFGSTHVFRLIFGERQI